mmetsp:Transcript_18136/g.50816  ORF Transcript_18136/g.50816 Transcript_18136/m.50816 type:complete len:526 (+) Transcript_18136:3-1580(+)
MTTNCTAVESNPSVGNKRPRSERMGVKVSVKWGKEMYKDLEVDTQEQPLAFKSLLFSLSGVPPERQKLMIKGALVGDTEWTPKTTPKEGATFMLMGSAEQLAVEPPKNLPKFLEDLPEAQQQHMETRAYGAGLQNLGNTCYMNSVLQCMYAVEPLREALKHYTPSAAAMGPTMDPITKLVVSAKSLMRELENGGEPFPPFQFLLTLRQTYPQFAQQSQEGFYSQQDAEECWTNLMYAIREKAKDASGKSVVEDLFGIGTTLKLKCEESDEELQEHATSYMLRCNIGSATNHLHEGILLGLRDDREKMSEKAGRTCLWKGTSLITRLPTYLTVQLVRFFYKVDTQNKAKVLRKVSFQHELDVYDFCAPELREALDGPRAAYKAYQDRRIQQEKEEKNAKGRAAEAASNGSNGSNNEAPEPSGSGQEQQQQQQGGGDVAMGEASGSGHEGAQTGKFELVGVLTHKGRSADSGHYTAWTKQADGNWVLFDDDVLHIKKGDDILNLSGGGDWHMAYLLIYRAITVPKGA